jgi:arylsulfatase A-like enzyme
MNQQTRREFLRTIGIAAASPGVLSAAPGCTSAGHTVTPEKKRPNVVLVMTDDQGYGDLACHGNSIIKTPNLDALHAQSTRLTNFHVGPTCSPTRASLMTGRYCNRTGVWHTVMGRSLLRKDEVTMADVFRAGGYKTGIFGKWHLGDNYPFRPQDRGFDEVLIHKGGGIGNTQDYWGNDYFDDTYFRNGRPERFEGYCTDVWFTEAIKFIEANKDRPFFCYLPTNFVSPKNTVSRIWAKASNSDSTA